ncbi:MAG TPA: FlgD immunoglobulin-like domain containing protein [Candidatus Cloacimonadota bacterium]|nr:FlgD immunoglobulin-like domain containing protein [Candidatus Cloacimonadota bacterium]
MYFISATRLDSRLRIAILAATFLFCLLGLSAQTAGDYRTKWAGNFDDLARWEFHNGNTWVNATTLPATPFTGTLYIRHQTDLYRNFTVLGNIIIAGNGNSIRFRVMDGGVFTLAPAARMEFDNIYIAPGGVLINNGTMTATVKNSALSIQANGELINNGIINTATGNQISLQITMASSGVDNPAIFTSGPEGSVSGSGSFNANYNSVINIANPGGVDEALHLSEGNSFAGAHFTFNGDTPQITGSTMPPSALGIVFSNPAGTALSQDINIVNEVLVTPGSTLNFGFSVLKRDYYGAGVFTMTAGATIYTAHPQGISSSMDHGSVQLTIRNFNSSANYGFNGQEPQEVEDFQTQPAVDPEGRVVVGNLIVENEAGVNFSNPILVEGTVVVNTGTATGDVQIDGDESFVDGINSSYYYHSFEANGNPIRNYRPQTDNGNQQQSQVRRRWRITGQMMGSKRVTFYWDAADDAHLDWSGSRPVVVKGNTTLTTLAYDLASEPRWITVQVSELEGRANFAIGIESDDTLPVELSAFDMVLSPGNKVRLRWISQSETALTGYLIYRSTTENLQDAILISSLIEPTNSSQTSYYNFDDSTVQPGTTYYYWLQSLDLDGGNQYHGPIRADLPYLDSPSTPGTLQTGLNRAYPNPFNPDLTISYSLERSSDVKLDVYNLRGQMISRLVQGSKSAGTHNYVWNGTDSRGQSLPSGSYLLVLEADEHRSVRKVTLLK